MSCINVSNIVVKNNPAPFYDPFAFSVTFECLQHLKEEIEWKIIYVGSPKDESYDQVIDSFTIGPNIEPGVMQFDMESSAPDYTKIPVEDLLGVAAIIHSVSYEKQEFFRVGYFVYNNYEDPFLIENPYPVQPDKIVRSILADKPRIIRHNIDWESDSTEKIKALNHILIENSNILNTDNNINFKGMFSDIPIEAQHKPEEHKTDFNPFNNWNNNLFQSPFGNNNNNNNPYAYPLNGMMEGNNNQPLGGGLFGNNDNQVFNNNPFNNMPTGGFNLFPQQQQQAGNDNFGMNDNGQRFGTGFPTQGGSMQDNGMNYSPM